MRLPCVPLACPTTPTTPAHNAASSVSLLTPVLQTPVQELEGSYMIVFGSAADALEWCLTVQEVMMEVSKAFRVGVLQL